MTAHTDSLNPITQTDKLTCPVCNGMKGPYETYCRGCEEYKKNAENLRKIRARRNAFGDLL